MRDIHCPEDIGFNNIFVDEEDCKLEQIYDNCYHCWSSAIAENNQKYFKRKFEEELEKLKEKINSEDIDCQYEEDYVYSSGLQKAIELIDNCIEELKGEQK